MYKKVPSNFLRFIKFILFIAGIYLFLNNYQVISVDDGQLYFIATENSVSKIDKVKYSKTTNGNTIYTVYTYSNNQIFHEELSYNEYLIYSAAMKLVGVEVEEHHVYPSRVIIIGVIIFLLFPTKTKIYIHDKERDNKR